MAIILAEETVYPLTEIPEHLPRRRGKKVHKSTVFRWRNGLRGVRLETIRCGGTLCTSLQAVQRFFDALSARDAEADSGGAPPIRTPAARAKALSAAERAAQALGI
jgi:hypothetical protein